MKNLVSINNHSMYTPSIFLERIWYIEGEEDFVREFRTPRQNIVEIKKDDDILVAIFTVSGCGSLELEQSEHILKKNSLVIFFINQRRIYKTVGDDWKFYWCEFKCGKAFFRIEQLYEFEAYPHERDYLPFCFQNLSKFCYSQYCTLLFEVLLFHATQEDTVDNNSNEVLDNAIDFISSEYGNNELRVADIAGHCHISERQLRNIFMENLHISPMHYLTQYRLEQAMQLLRMNRYTVNQVALSVGFANQYYFSKVFKDKYSACPSMYLGK